MSSIDDVINTKPLRHSFQKAGWSALKVSRPAVQNSNDRCSSNLLRLMIRLNHSVLKCSITHYARVGRTHGPLQTKKARKALIHLHKSAKHKLS